MDIVIFCLKYYADLSLMCTNRSFLLNVIMQFVN